MIPPLVFLFCFVFVFYRSNQATKLEVLKMRVNEVEERVSDIEDKVILARKEAEEKREKKKKQKQLKTVKKG